MTPLEAAIRAVSTAMGADPETWRGFVEVGRAGADAYRSAFIAMMPEPLRMAVAAWLATLPPEFVP